MGSFLKCRVFVFTGAVSSRRPWLELWRWAWPFLCQSWQIFACKRWFFTNRFFGFTLVVCMKFQVVKMCNFESVFVKWSWNTSLVDRCVSLGCFLPGPFPSSSHSSSPRSCAITTTGIPSWWRCGECTSLLAGNIAFIGMSLVILQTEA